MDIEHTPEPRADLPQLDRLRLDFTALDPIRLPAYSGSAWRGLFGRGLRQSVCITRAPTCDGCPLLGQCVYPRVFESPPTDPAARARYTALPHPFVIALAGTGPADPAPAPAARARDAPRSLPPGAPLHLGLVLIGTARDLLPYVIHAWQHAGTLGFGQRDGRFRLARVDQEQTLGAADWTTVYDPATGPLRRLATAPAPASACPDRVHLDLLTPLRLKRQGRFIGPKHLTAADLLRTLATRLAVLAEHHQPDAAPFDWTGIHEAIAATAITEARLHWHEWTRYSSRQRTEMQFGGLRGTCTLAGDGLPRLWPLLRLGQWTHVGKGTSFGLGQYRLTAPPPA